MSDEICIVGKGNSLLSEELGNIIDQHKIVIRVNHLPTLTTQKFVGTKTTILATRSPYKLEPLRNNVALRTAKTWICTRASEYNGTSLEPDIFINEAEFNFIKKIYVGFLQKEELKGNDIKYGFCMPDTGIATVLLTLLRYKQRPVNVCGFDLYTNGNKNVFEENKPNSSIFFTPVMQQLVMYKSLLKKQKIQVLNSNV